MKPKMPSTINGRDVHLVRIDKKIVKQHNPWDIIMQCIADGRWYQMGGTENLSTKDKTKLHTLLVNRIWFAGYGKQDLCVRVTEANGICFRWLSGKVPDPAKIAVIRAERLEVRRIKQKNRRQLKKEGK